MFQAKYECCCPDWEATGNEEVSEILKRIEDRVTILQVRERLDNVLELLKICRDSLEESSRIDIKSTVCNVLYFQVEKEIKEIEEELACINL